LGGVLFRISPSDLITSLLTYNITAQLHIERALVATGPRKELHPVTKTASRPDRENDVQKSFLDRVIYVLKH